MPNPPAEPPLDEDSDSWIDNLPREIQATVAIILDAFQASRDELAVRRYYRPRIERERAQGRTHAEIAAEIEADKRLGEDLGRIVLKSCQH